MRRTDERSSPHNFYTSATSSIIKLISNFIVANDYATGLCERPIWSVDIPQTIAARENIIFLVYLLLWLLFWNEVNMPYLSTQTALENRNRLEPAKWKEFRFMEYKYWINEWRWLFWHCFFRNVFFPVARFLFDFHTLDSWMEMWSSRLRQ